MPHLIVTTTTLSKNSKTIIEINENLKFAIIPQKCVDMDNCYELEIKKINGDFELQNVSYHLGNCEFKNKNTFLQHSLWIDEKTEHVFSLLTDDVKFNVVVSAIYEFKIEEEQIKYLEAFELFRGKIILSKQNNKTFEYTVSKGPTGYAVITVKNSEGVRINGLTGDYTFSWAPDNGDIVQKLSFVFKAD
uniref:Uncharacterized protein n=1 Tax=Panagrolaimus superbus TaxID=310955 RepID=A0A914YWE1_9BILA